MSSSPSSSPSSSSSSTSTSNSGYVSLSPDRRFWTSIHKEKEISVYDVSSPIKPMFTISFNHNPYVAEYYSPENILFIVANTCEFKTSDIILYDVTSKRVFNMVSMDDFENVHGLRVCGNNLVVVTDSFIILEQIQVARSTDGALATAALKVITKEKVTKEKNSGLPVYDTVVSGDIAYTVFLQDIYASQAPQAPQTQGSQSFMKSVWSYMPSFKKLYSPHVSASPSDCQSIFLIQKQYLRHDMCTKLDGPYVIDKGIGSICISCDGKYVAFSYLSGKYVAVYDTADGSMRAFFRGKKEAQITSLFISSDDRFLTCTSTRGTIHIFNILDPGSLVDSSYSLSVSSTVKTAGYYPRSFKRIGDKPGWKAFIKGTSKNQDLKIVLVSPDGYEESRFNDPGLIKE